MLLDKVDVHVEIVSSCQRPRVIIQTSQQSELVDRIIKAINEIIGDGQPQMEVIAGGRTVMINQNDVIRIYTENRRLIIHTSTKNYESYYTLRRIEEILDRNQFVRISRFEIINLNRVAGFDFSINGTVNISFDDGSSTWVARRYVSSIQQKLNGLRQKEVLE